MFFWGTLLWSIVGGECTTDRRGNLRGGVLLAGTGLSMGYSDCRMDVQCSLRRLEFKISNSIYQSHK